MPADDDRRLGTAAGAAPHQLAAPRTLLLAVANTAATIIFILFGMVAWRLALPMLAGAVIGGNLGARVGRVLPPLAVRIVTIAVTATMTVLFFVRAYA